MSSIVALTRLLAFRWLFVYVLLFVFPVTWSELVPWVAQTFLGLAPPEPSGSGDTAYSYVRIAVDASVATVVAVGWTAWNRSDASHPTLWRFEYVVLRLYLLMTMLGYGLAKVFKSQFPDISLMHLTTPLGELSPMRLAWSYMGHSLAYNIFTGAAEVIGGLLLVSRRTTPLGALVLVAVMSNVVMLNLSYDIPVKQYSIHLLLAAGLLLAPDARRLVDVLLRGRGCEARTPAPLFSGTRAHRIGQIVKVLLVAVVLGLTTIRSWTIRSTHAPEVHHGLWSVERFERDGTETPTCLDEPRRWREVATGRRYAVVRDMADVRSKYRAELDADEGTLKLKPRDGETLTFRIEWIGPDRLRLEGVLDGQPVEVELRRAHRTFLLRERGFHWISERPFNP